MAVCVGHEMRPHTVLEFGSERAVSFGCDHTLRVWNTTTGQCLAVYELDGPAVRGAVDTDKATVLVTTKGYLHVWHAAPHLRSMYAVVLTCGHVRQVVGTSTWAAVIYSHGGRACGEDHKVQLLIKRFRRFKSLSHPTPVAALAAAGTTLASACAQTIKLWNATTTRLIRCLPATIGLVMEMSMEGNVLALRDTSNTVEAWDVVTGEQLFRESFSFDIDRVKVRDKMVITCNEFYRVRYYNARTGAKVYDFENVGSSMLAGDAVVKYVSETGFKVCLLATAFNIKFVMDKAHHLPELPLEVWTRIVRMAQK